MTTVRMSLLLTALMVVATGAMRHHAQSLSPGPDFKADAPLKLDNQPRRDLYGNEVDDAVATYRLDARGGLYEEHSPRTEMPRLASPQG